MKNKKIIKASAKKAVAFALTALIFATVLSLFAFAETGGIMSENIPDTNIGGATGGASEFVSEMASDIMSDIVPNGTNVPESSTDMPSMSPEKTTGVGTPEESTSNAVDSNEQRRSVFGIIIAIAVAVAIIMLILAFIPRNKKPDSHGGKENK